jgi:uncharacterized RDD family membrane protein YckC
VKCPKCHYLSFDPEPRCRNCGYTLALDPDLAINREPAAAEPLADLTLRSALDPQDPPPAADSEIPRPARRRTPPTPPPSEPVIRQRTTAPGPFDDVADAPLRDLDESPENGSLEDDGLSLFEAEINRRVEASPPPPPPAPPRERRPVAPPPTSELPLFVKGMGGEVVEEPAATESPDDYELKLPPPAAPPLSVRRNVESGPARAREVEPPKIGPLDRDLLDGLQRIEREEKRKAAAEARQARTVGSADAGRRLTAAVVDAVLLGGISAGIVTATLRWVGRDWSAWQSVPLVPLAAFALLIALGYLFMFTAASGQTAGKMLAGIRVVDAGADGAGEERVSVRQALYRSALMIPSVCLAGVGFLPGLVGERRALHDRLTQTRVVRA